MENVFNPDTATASNPEDQRSYSTTPSEEYIFIRIYVPDLNIQKCFQFSKDRFLSDVKQQCILSLPLELKQSFNYGLYRPPTENKFGKFLDEEKTISEHMYTETVGYLELKYKQRIYRHMKIDEKQFKAIHTRTNLRRFMDYINNGQVEKVTKLCSKGLDPNFYCVETGETPLTLATTFAKSGKTIMALVNGGAFLDFRNLEGTTAVHRAVEQNNMEAVTTLLELGASPNMKDARGVTPLYLAITRKCDSQICERLLMAFAIVGTQDNQGWQEIHQACRNGLLHHLELLLIYGADINAKNASGNTPLHVCAVNSQEACAKLLLQKGASTDGLNFANQTPYQMAAIAGNLELARLIQNYKSPVTDNNIGDGSDVISNNSSGIGTVSSDVTESNFTSKYSDCLNSSVQSEPGNYNNNTLLCKSRASYAPYEGRGDGMSDPSVFRPSHNMKDRALNANRYYATAPRQKKQLPVEPRTVILHRTKRGFGFILRGAKATSTLMDVQVTDNHPALQYLDDVDKGGVADLAGLRKGDYILSINGLDVSKASHEQVVDMIRNSGQLVSITVVSRNTNESVSSNDSRCSDTQASIPLSYATLPNKLKNRSSSIGHTIAPLPPRRDPKTTLSVGKAKSKNFLSKLGHWENVDKQQTESSASAQPKTASIRSRPISSRITTAELEELFQRQADVTPCHDQNPKYASQEHGNARVYASVADMKKRKSSVASKNASEAPPDAAELTRRVYSVPDLVKITMCGVADQQRSHKSQEDISGSEPSSPLGECREPMHSTLEPTSDKRRDVASGSGSCGVNSSFNPNNTAVLYALPAECTKESCSRNQIRKSASLHNSLKINKNQATSKPSVTIRECRNRNAFYTRSICGNMLPLSPPPPIPDPDYSQSDEESEKSNKTYKTSTLPLPGTRKSTLGGGIGHQMPTITMRAINVDEIRKARSQLRSASFADGAARAARRPADEDNSSSGVSSDQEASWPHRSLLRLPADGVDQLVVVPPPPEFVGGTPSVEVFEPPPQFSDRKSPSL